MHTVQLMEVPIATALDSSAWALLFRPLIFPTEASKGEGYDLQQNPTDDEH
jgi:hypothetical protein